MLTQEQKENLHPLTKDPKFGKLLQKAIEIWSLDNINPVYATWGLNRKNNVWDTTKHCCLAGASIVGMNHSVFFKDSVSLAYNLSDIEVTDLITGFDSFRSYFEYSKAYIFGKSVAKILFL